MRRVSVIVDRPIGYKNEFGTVYPVNYGYVPNIMAGDGEEQDAYILGEDKPVKRYEGYLIAIVKRKDDVEDKWVVADKAYTLEEIKTQIEFLEKYFDSTVQLLE